MSHLAEHSEPVNMEIDSMSAGNRASNANSSSRSARQSARSAVAAAVSAAASSSSNATGESERERLRAEQAKEKERELNELMNEDGAQESSPSKGKSTSKSSSSGLGPKQLFDVETPGDDDESKSRTKHNKRMKYVIKEGAVKQERFVRKHLDQFRNFMTKKTLKRYSDSSSSASAAYIPATTAAVPGVDDGGEDVEEQAANVRAGAQAAAQSAANPDGTRVILPASEVSNADLKDDALPKTKIFHKQPSYIINGEMREYQILGLNWLINRHENAVGGILGDEMGLGKTLQVIAFLSYLKYERGITGPHLIVVPLSVMSAWLTEFKRWSPGFRVVRYHGPSSERRRLENEEAAFGNFDVILTSYEMIVSSEDFFRYKFIWSYIIVDEAHRIKNEKTLQAQALAAIQRYNTILLTGTPTQNSTHELWSLLYFILPRVFASSAPFDSCFNLATNSIDQERLMQIHELLKPLMLRRVKAEIQNKLPPKTETKVYVGLSEIQRQWYKRLVSRDMSLLLSSSAAATGEAITSTTTTQQGNEWRRLMSLMMMLRKLTNHPYLIAGEENWDDVRKVEAEEDRIALREGRQPPKRESIEARAGRALIESSGKMVVLDKLLTRLKAEGHRVLLFSLFTRVLDLLEDYFNWKGWAFLRLDGSTNRVRRGVDIRRFNDPHSRFFVYLISTRAGGLGINLQSADTVIHFDSDFNPQSDIQAASRCHRIGQTKPVNVYRFVTENTVEERLIARAEKKLYLDLMVNRFSNSEAMEHIGENEAAELTKLTKDEVLSMLMFGASRILKTTASTSNDENIDVILSRSRQKAEEFKASKIKALLEKKEKLAKANESSKSETQDLLNDDGQKVISEEMAELKKLHANDPSAAASASSSSEVKTESHVTAKDFLFDQEKKVSEFEGKDYTSAKKSKKELLAQQTAELIITGDVKRERKSRLITVEDGNGRAFMILADQQHDEPLRDQRARGKKRGRPSAASQYAAFGQAVTPQKALGQGYMGSMPTTPFSPMINAAAAAAIAAASSPSAIPINLVDATPDVIEPKVIGYDWAIDWNKSNLADGDALVSAVQALNANDVGDVDVTDDEHKLSLWVKRFDRWNMSEFDRAEFKRKQIEEQKAVIALRNAKRLRWAEGAPEEDWLADTTLEAVKNNQMVSAGVKGRPKSKGPNGEYVFGNKYVHEEWCQVCKMGGELVCCGYCFTDDHQILTNQGFMFLSEVREAMKVAPVATAPLEPELPIVDESDDAMQLSSARVAMSGQPSAQHSDARVEAASSEPSPLLFAAYDTKRDQLVYQTASRLIVNPPGSSQVIDFTSKNERHRWTSASDEYGSLEGEDASNGLSLRVTAEHRMYVRNGKQSLGGEVNWAPLPFAIQTAESLLTKDESSFVKMTGVAREGFVGTVNDMDLPFVRELNLSTSAEIRDFLELYGYWLSGASLDVTNACINFSLKNAFDMAWVKQRLTGLSLVEDSDYRCSEKANGQLSIQLFAASYVSYFCTQNGLPNSSLELRFWNWVWNLRLELARDVIRGLCLADSEEVGDRDTIYTSSAILRDDIIRLAMHAGYSATFTLDCKAGAHCGFASNGLPIVASHDNWKVKLAGGELKSEYTDHFSEPVLNAKDDIRQLREDEYKGETWCVTVPAGLIVARRAIVNADGVVTKASRPIIIGNCPRTFHKECLGMNKIPPGYFSCPQHKCAKCERTSAEAGGMLFRCVVCPCAWCEDDVPTEYEGRRDLDRCFELEQTGYMQPSSAFFITCSKSCTDYYQAYLDGKFEDTDVGVDIEAEKQHREFLEEQRVAKEREDAVKAAAVEAAEKGKRGAGSRRTKPASGGDVTMATSTSTSNATGGEEEEEEEAFVYEPPKELPPHICPCLIPKKQKPRLYCSCRTPYDRRRNYLACDGCGQWFHLTCAGFKEDHDVELQEWTCKPCQQKERQRAQKNSGVFELDSDASDDDASDDDEDELSDSDVDEEGKKKKKRKRRSSGKGATPLRRGRNSEPGANATNELADFSSSNKKQKKSKIRHPVQGGSLPAMMDTTGSSSGSAAAAPAQPTLEEAFRMNLGLLQGQMGQMGQMPQLDPAAWSQMVAYMQQGGLGMSGGLVGADGTVQQLPALPLVNAPLALAPLVGVGTQPLLSAPGIASLTGTNALTATTALGSIPFMPPGAMPNPLVPATLPLTSQISNDKSSQQGTSGP